MDGGPSDDDAAWAPRASGRPAASEASAAGPSLLPGYRDFVLVARGGDSVVYRAHQDALDRDVAIKVVQLDDAASVARFRRELEITVRLGRQHPNIMTVLATGTTTDGQPCLVMDYYELGSLASRLSERGPLPVHEVVAAGAVVADALAFAHAQGVLHRDVKPQNVLVLPTSWVLADFGLARAIDAEHSASLERFSYRHASPQVLDGEAPTVGDDVYSLGSTLFTLLDGRPPFAADDPDEDSALSYLRRARTEPPRVLRRDDLPDELAAVVRRCLEKDPAARFADAAALRAALDALPTESRRWAPSADLAPAAPVPQSAPPAAREPVESDPEPVAEPEPALEAEPVEAEPMEAEPAAEAEPAVEAEPVSVSALAHLEAAPSEPAAADATGRRPEEPDPDEPADDDGTPAGPPARASRRAWLAVGAAAVVALVAGVLIGVLGGGDDTGPKGAHHSSAGALGDPSTGRATTPTTTAPPSTTSASTSATSTSGGVRFDPKTAPTITSITRHGDRVELHWTDPTKGAAQFVVLHDDPDNKEPMRPTFPRGSRAGTVAGVAAGHHCFVVSGLAASGGHVTAGTSHPRCVG